jgi:hypothetical protein
MNNGLGELEALLAMGLQPEGLPDPRHRRLRHPTSEGIDRVDQRLASLGVLSNVMAMTSSTWASVTVRERPGRGSSVNPSERYSANRERDLRTHRQMHTKPLRDLSVVEPLSRRRHDPRR